MTLLHPLGHPVEFESNSAEALLVAQDSWGAWPRLFDQAPLRISIQVHDGPPPAADPRFEVFPDRLEFFCDNATEGIVNPASRTGQIHVSRGMLAQRGRFRHVLLEAVVLTALDAVFFTPLHAACVERNGVGVLLCGDSGAGKSTLAYACARREWTLIADESVHLAPAPSRTVVGGSRHIRLREPAYGLFPELHARAAAPAPNGKLAIELDARALGLRAAASAGATHCVFLARRPGPAKIASFPGEEAVAYFLKYIAPRDCIRPERRLREFLSGDASLLSYQSAEDAVSVLDGWV